jgi:ABC-type uncharacterized transport system permease subunit
VFGLVATAARHSASALKANRWLAGILFIIIGVLVVGLFALNVPTDNVSTYRLSGGGDPIQLPHFTLPTAATDLVLGFIILSLGAYQLWRGFTRITLVASVVFVLVLIAFLTWSIRGASLNLTGLAGSTLLRATPFLLGALSGIMCERSGVINIAIEGMMLIAAFVSVVVASITQNLWLGLVAGLASGAIIAAFHAWLSIQFKVDQIISGTVINIFAVGFTNYMVLRLLQVRPELNNSGTFDAVPIPILSSIPVVGTIIFDQNILVYAALILMFVVHFMLFYTRWGLRTRAVGEHPLAADTLGINVYRMRYLNVVLGGVLAAMGGCYLSLGSVGRFDRLMSGGRGFIALAAMIFGNWSPFGAFASSLIFGFADSLQVKLQILTSVIPSDFLVMAPYLATMVVLAGVVGRAIPPAADGKPYEKQ